MSTLDPKDPDVSATYEIDWFGELITDAEPSADLEAGEVIRAQRDTGWLYEVTTGGRTSENYPQWPRAEAETVRWGSALLTTKHPDDVSVPQVQSADWTVPDGLTLESQSESGYVTSITLSGGTDGEDYEVLCRMTPTSGNIIEQTITVPVRAQ